MNIRVTRYLELWDWIKKTIPDPEMRRDCWNDYTMYHSDSYNLFDEFPIEVLTDEHGNQYLCQNVTNLSR